METIRLKKENDSNIIKAALSGNQKAYTLLFDKYRRPVYFLIIKIVKNYLDAEDILHDTFTKAFSNLHNYSNDFAFTTWLFKIASNTSIDFVRKKKMSLISIDDINNECNSNREIIRCNMLNPHESLFKSQRADIIKELIGTIEPTYKKLIELRYYRELTYEEIATELEIPLGTVKAKLFRARKIMEEKISNNVMTNFIHA